MNIAALIPAYNPDNKLVEYVKELSASSFEHIIIVDDGSSDRCQHIFDACAAYPQCVILKHAQNMGKGCGLKTGMQYALDNLKHCDGIITCDADGQHLVDDTIKVAQSLVDHPESLILGARDFSLPGIPARSSFGNKMTSRIFKLLYRRSIADTQTGLRGIPTGLIPLMLSVTGDRFEYETNMLINCFTHKIDIQQVKISTVYLDDNSSSNFRAIVDSAKIYWVIFRVYIVYALSAGASFIVDISIYTLLIRFAPVATHAYGIYIASFGARLVSCIVNFTVNRTIVFRSKENTSASAVKYFLTVLLVIFLSSNLVKLVSVALNVPAQNTTIVKLGVDCVLFCFTFMVEKMWVFKKK